MYHKWKSYDVGFLRYGVWQTEFFVILGHFLPFYPTNNSTNPNFDKWKKHLEKSSFYTCVRQMTIIYDVWFLRYGVRREIFLSFWAIFWKMKKKPPGDIITWVPLMKIISWMVPEIWSATDKIFGHFGPFFVLYCTNNTNSESFLALLTTPFPRTPPSPHRKPQKSEF